MTPRFSWTVFVCAVLQQAILPSGSAEPSQWHTNAADSRDGRFLFVSISDRPLDEELKDEELTGEERDKIEFFRLHYPIGGMYLNDNSYTLIWKYDRQWTGLPIVAPDGEHVIFEGPWTWNEDEVQAVEFTRRGETLRSYAEVDFIATYWLKFLLNGRSAPSCKSTSFDPARMTYTIETNQGEKYVFNVKNGRLLEVDSPFPFYYSIVSAAATGLIVAFAYWIRRRNARART